MKQTLIPASFLSVALKTTVMKKDDYMYIIREENKENNRSRLYSLFFGTMNNVTATNSADEQPGSEPDYFSSYE